jgi:hypothetical protein
MLFSESIFGIRPCDERDSVKVLLTDHLKILSVIVAFGCLSGMVPTLHTLPAAKKKASLFRDIV